MLASEVQLVKIKSRAFQYLIKSELNRYLNGSLND